jgi:hypothetical protein
MIETTDAIASLFHRRLPAGPLVAPPSAAWVALGRDDIAPTVASERHGDVAVVASERRADAAGLAAAAGPSSSTSGFEVRRAGSGGVMKVGRIGLTRSPGKTFDAEAAPA